MLIDFKNPIVSVRTIDPYEWSHATGFQQDVTGHALSEILSHGAYKDFHISAEDPLCKIVGAAAAAFLVIYESIETVAELAELDAVGRKRVVTSLSKSERAVSRWVQEAQASIGISNLNDDGAEEITAVSQ